MNPIVQNKIDAVLDRVKDKQSGLSIAELGLVQKIRYNESNRKLIVFMNRLGKSKACCSVLNLAILSELEHEIKQELRKEFPWFRVIFAEPQEG